MQKTARPSKRLSRRTLMRGVGAAVALPWLEAMTATNAIAMTPAKPPVRLGFFYVPNGVNMEQWRCGDAGEISEPSKILQPLVDHGVMNRTVVLSNLEAKHCKGPGAGHEPAGGGFLVGKKCKHSEEPEVGGVSVDQLAAREIGFGTPIDSLALGVDPGHRGDHGFSGSYLSHISWRNKTTPAALELNPRKLYDRLFRGRKPRQPNWGESPSLTKSAELDPIEASLLDLVRDDTRSLQRQLGFADRRRLEEYLDGLRSIERRIELSEQDSGSHHSESFDKDPANVALHAGESLSDLPNLIFPDGRGIPKVYGDHVNLMLDILTLAFQTDTTRVGSFMFSYEKSGRSYREIGAPGSHHSTSHHQSKADKLAELTKINTHHMELFARMLDRMSKIKEGDSTLLDNVALLYGSGISDGNEHNHDDLPVMVCGGGGGAIQGGRHVVFEKPTPLCNVYVDLLQTVGVEKNEFGDSTGPTEKLSGSA
ncbi:DUF1552 domain-containing protein [Stieleria marina]|uniref:DUF1552 domain-containing protein n=1 Tax=Stieleria marina TaxID=1930275 RepID=A0A517NTV1_9BACT|nr:hypothetical protein K239x_25070 [Planctomycetes bacterium K23_9]